MICEVGGIEETWEVYVDGLRAVESLVVVNGLKSSLIGVSYTEFPESAMLPKNYSES